MAQIRHVNYTLTPIEISKAKPAEKAYSLTDGGGLLVEVLPTGTKVWRFKYHFEGKREKVTIGPYPAWSVKAARDRHEQLRELLAKGQSPARTKVDDEKRAKAEAESRVTLAIYAGKWADETLFYRSATYRAQQLRWLEQYAFPFIGDKALADVEPADVLAIIERLRDRPTTAEGVRMMLQAIFNHAIRKLLIKYNPAAAMKGVVLRPPRKHAPHLTEKEVGAFWRVVDIQGAHASTVLATKLLMLTMVRKMELLRAKRLEFDLVAGVWEVPAERMKMRRPHRVLLSTQAAELVRLLDHFAGESAYLVPSIHRKTAPMGEATLNHFFDRMDFGRPDFSPHGLRGTAATLLLERGVRKDVVELLLAHTENDRTVAAYHHHELLPERKAAMQLLADTVDQLAAGAKVIQLRA